MGSPVGRFHVDNFAGANDFTITHSVQEGEAGIFTTERMISFLLVSLFSFFQLEAAQGRESGSENLSRLLRTKSPLSSFSLSCPSLLILLYRYVVLSWILYLQDTVLKLDTNTDRLKVNKIYGTIYSNPFTCHMERSITGIYISCTKPKIHRENHVPRMKQDRIRTEGTE